MGGVLVMGRATYDSIGRPLPGRTTIVVTRNPDWSADGVLVAHSLEDALALAAEQPGETFVVGGTQIYEQALPARHPPGAHRGRPGAGRRRPLPRVRPRRVGRDPARAARRVHLGLVGAASDTPWLDADRSIGCGRAPGAAVRADPDPDRPAGGRRASCRPAPSCRRCARWPRPWASPRTRSRGPIASWSTPAWSRTRGRNGTVVNGDGSRAGGQGGGREATPTRCGPLGVRQDEALELVRRAFDRPVSS